MVLAVLVPLLFIGGVAVNQLLTLGDSLRQAFLDPEGISRHVTAALGPLISELPEREQVMLYLRFYEGMTQSEIAKRLGISQMHVSRLLSRSLQQLRELAEPPD